MTDPDSAGSQSLFSFLNDIRRGKWLALFLLASQAAFAFPAGIPHVFSSGGQAHSHASLFEASIVTLPMVQESRSTEEKETGQGTGVASAQRLAAIQTAIAGVHSPDLQMLGRSLGLDASQIGHQPFEDSTLGMETVSGLSDGGASVVAVKWGPADQGQSAPVEASPNLYLLSWDGNGWQASFLSTAGDALTLEVLPDTEGESPLFAVIIYRGITAVPYPVIFRFQDHRASRLWDGRADSTSYTGYDYGSIQFEKVGEGNVPVMVAAGLADPGLLMFPASQQQSGRGFQAATVYVWKNDAYVPLRTEYTHNRDYVLYSFISALHLHDFKAAYSLIDPEQFLKTKKPSLELFRKEIQDAWPEFIDDRIFEVPAHPEMELEDHTFILRLGGGRVNVYHPTFTPGPDYRLTGLTRTESNE